MKAIKYLVAGLLVMGLAAPAMAQDVNYKDMLKPIEIIPALFTYSRHP